MKTVQQWLRELDEDKGVIEIRSGLEVEYLPRFMYYSKQELMIFILSATSIFYKMLPIS